MPIDSIPVFAAMVAMFVVFGAAIGWADLQSRMQPQPSRAVRRRS
jgi:hypothetical protein